MDSRGFNRPAASSWVLDEVTKFVALLKCQWRLDDLSEELPPRCPPFIKPKTSEKVFLILSCVKQNGLDGCPPPPLVSRFRGCNI